MTESGTSSRERIVAGAADMISRRGLSAMSIRKMAEHAGTPLGSTYHFFPEGKQQLATEAVRYAGKWAVRAFRGEPGTGPDAGLMAFVDVYRTILVESDFHAGCPVLAVAIEEPRADEIPPALEAAAEVLDTWAGLLATSLRNHGVEAEQAAQIATLVVAAIEGAVAMCRAKRSTDPLDHTAAQLHALVSGAIRGSGSSSM
ncbi:MULTISPECIES: TetR/AcrR family transcriptional regulator [unclassified Streptomyces]|uniref:TetR/AcrR family transcriptional regulator n=1 Tax=unclassified Streptomyces TaxID=2593676 RepID=UPI000F5C013E|nr:TetR/AcrR family transcriptional regulator [Streptomyces sp. ADI95-17]RPK59212.1 putative HTH-type transcriptional regulator YxaF [Streptomyces sp. ADI95-17]WSG55489.1 TetR/AcrR family transcriptional regulator [Streptomyces sp. NBC_01732]WSX06628.1 TetR/AcrR family transcriptional regulator [Streptomyces sp. NBC_00987]